MQCVYLFKNRDMLLSSRRRGGSGVGTVLSNEQIFSERRTQREIRGRDGQTHQAVGGEKPAEDRGSRTGRPCASADRRSPGGKHGDGLEMLKRTQRNLTGSRRWMSIHQAGNPEITHAEDKPLMDAVD